MAGATLGNLPFSHLVWSLPATGKRNKKALKYQLEGVTVLTPDTRIVFELPSLLSLCMLKNSKF